MSLFNILSAALIALTFAAGLVLFSGLQAAGADLLPAVQAEAS
jgi:hypothetical protein